MLTVPPTALFTAVTDNVWPLSFAGPLESFALGSIMAGLSSAVVAVSPLAVGLSFTSVTFTFTVAVSDFGSAVPFVVPLSVIVYVNESGP